MWATVEKVSRACGQQAKYGMGQHGPAAAERRERKLQKQQAASMAGRKHGRQEELSVFQCMIIYSA